MKTLSCQTDRCPAQYTTNVQDVIETKCLVSYFPEYRFPPVDRTQYCARLKEGHQIASNSKVAVLCCIRDLGQRIGRTFLMAETIGNLFKDYIVCIYENDSTDDTVTRAQEWVNTDSNHRRLVSEKRNWQKWKSVRSGRRGEMMAHYRNVNRDMAKDFMPDYYVVFDADLYAISTEGITNSLYWLNHQYHAMLANGIMYSMQLQKVHQYDVWAWRRLNDWAAKSFNDIAPIVPKRGEDPIQVFSAFGGCGIYAREVYEACKYSGGDCEHVMLHRDMRNKGFSSIAVNPSLIVLYNDVTEIV